ncbi:MAG: phosphoglycerate kinase [Bacteriovoracaceae bacterium]|nr:phosphoglycerate kinase [Bacteriovoracaceae bacterium]
MQVKYIDQIPLKGKKVVARFDFNVPLSKDGKNTITDASRIDLSLPTIQYMLEQGVTSLVLMSHLGRPDGKVNKKYSLEPVAAYLAEKLNQDVILAEGAVDTGIKPYLKTQKAKIILLENLRFSPGEEDNDPEFAKKLAEYADIYVNDAFGVSHRKHASVHAITHYFKNHTYGGFLIKREVEALNKVLNSPKKPMIAIIGGAKVSDKIKTIQKLLVTVDHMLIGGAMAYPFLKATGVEVGKSLCSDEDVQLAKTLLAQDRGNKIQLPVDHVASEALDGSAKVIESKNIPEKYIGLDIGPQTIKNYGTLIMKSATILWNGPMGYFENPKFAEGTMSMAKSISNSKAFSVVGGGDSVSAVQKSGLADKFSHVSTGGGASLEYIEKGDLPGIQALRQGVDLT